MKRILVGIVFLWCHCVPFNGFSQIKTDPVSAWIELDLDKEEDTNVRAHFTNNTNQSLTLFYRLKVERTGKSGTAINNQSGEFSTIPGETKLLSEAYFYAANKDYYKILLEIYDELDLLTSDSLIHGNDPREKKKVITNKDKEETKPSANKSEITETAVPNLKSTPKPKSKIISTAKASKPKPVDFLEIDGLIIDETRSKIGRDFYDIFYKKWVAPKNASNFTILIKELPSRGRGIQISVIINDDELFQRFVPPQIETIEAVANYAIRRVRGKLQQNADVQKAIQNKDAEGSGIF